MKTTQVKSRSRDMSFEAWMRRPVYKAQCLTMSIAYQICGVHSLPDRGRATAYGDERKDGLSRFRCLPPYRDTAAKSLRRQVADHIKAMRREAALMC